MKRFNIALDDAVYEVVKRKAKENKVDEYIFLYNLICENLSSSDFNYYSLMNDIYSEIERMKAGKFILNDLKTFQKIKMVEFDGKSIKPITIRARVGRAFYNAVINNKVKNVSVVMKDKENSQKRFNAVLYEKI